MVNSTRFIHAFNEIEHELDKRLSSNRYIGFVEKVRRLSKQDKEILRYQKLLEDFSSLRNAIVHNQIGSEAIAEPHDRIVEKIEHLAQLLTKPTLVKDWYLCKVDISFDDENLLKIAKRLVEKSYSQIPVYNREHQFVGMLSTDSMIRYFVHNHYQIDHSVLVKDVLPYGKDIQRVAFLSPDNSLLDVVNLFESTMEKGKKLQVILVTKQANRNHLPLGVITVHELPAIYEEISE